MLQVAETVAVRVSEAPYWELPVGAVWTTALVVGVSTAPVPLSVMLG